MKGFKDTKKSAYLNSEGLWVSCDGTTIKDRKPHINLKPNHFKREPTRRVIRTPEQTLIENKQRRTKKK